MASNQEKYLPAEELSLFCEQVAMILHAGIPLYDGIETLAVSYKDSRYGDRFLELYQAVIKYGQLSDALEKSNLFPPYLVAMTRIGERAGRLDEVLSALSRYYSFEAELRDTVKNAVLYPTVLILMLAVVIAILVVSVLPIFSRVFESLGASTGGDLGVMAVGVGVGRAVLIVVGVVIVALGVVALLLRSKKRKETLEFLSKASPGIARVRMRISAGRFANVISIMLISGYPLESAMEIAKSVVEDDDYRARIGVCQSEMQKGKTFVEAVSKASLFEELHEKMLTFGAAAGQLDAVMAKLADIYGDEARNSIHSLVSLIEPTLVAILSVVIGGILLSVTLPLLSVLSALA